jgi:hypothetical protein
MENLALNLQGLTAAIKRSFLKWLASSRYAQVYADLSDEVKEIIDVALSEVQPLKPGQYDLWWACNHNRWIRNPGVMQQELQRMHELLFPFLLAFSRGELNIKEESVASNVSKPNEKETRKTKFRR